MSHLCSVVITTSECCHCYKVILCIMWLGTPTSPYWAHSQKINKLSTIFIFQPLSCILRFWISLDHYIISHHLIWAFDAVMQGDIATTWRVWPGWPSIQMRRGVASTMSITRIQYSAKPGNLTPPTFNRQIRNLTSGLQNSHTFWRICVCDF